jgi:hypothetical protein
MAGTADGKGFVGFPHGRVDKTAALDPFFDMRRTFLLVVAPPLIALAVVGGGLGLQYREMSELQDRTKGLRTRMERETRSAVPEKDSSASVIDGKRIDWGKLLALKGEAQSRAFTPVERLLYDLSAEELLANLDQLAAVNGPAKLKEELERRLLHLLGRRDPRRLFDRFSEEIGVVRTPRSGVLHAAFAHWSEQDCPAAAAWLDAQVAAGTFESKSLNGLHSRQVDFESELVRSGVSRDAAGAIARIAAMQEPLRSAVLKNDLLEWGREAEEAKKIANLIREVAGEAQAPQMLAESSFQRIARSAGDRQTYENLDRLFQDIEATPKERETVALYSLSVFLRDPKWTEREDVVSYVDGMRTWALSEAPGAANELTVKALGQLGAKRFDDAAKLAIRYQEASGDDAVLVAFLNAKGLVRAHPAEALPLLERISDPAKREATRKLFPKQP